MLSECHGFGVGESDLVALHVSSSFWREICNSMPHGLLRVEAEPSRCSCVCSQMMDTSTIFPWSVALSPDTIASTQLIFGRKKESICRTKSLKYWHHLFDFTGSTVCFIQGSVQRKVSDKDPPPLSPSPPGGHEKTTMS